MKGRIKILSALTWLTPAILLASDFVYRPVAVTPPPVLREFRAAWITVVASNQDWPSEPGLPVAQQKAELISLLDRAAQLHFNAVFLQIRPSCDALYASTIEPWSERLTGVMGRAPEPFYDPLAFAIQEAHKRGLELHAWFNPFRALHPLAKSPVAWNHVTKTHPEWIRDYDTQYWLDPGEPAARDYVLRVIMDVVRRYNVDGVVFDDYFYPYPVKNALGHKLDYPDDVTWRKFGLPTGLTRDDWRRQNVNDFVRSVYQSIKAAKPWVQFGISPFGIWRPQPPLVKGLDAYASLYADSRLWLASGWVDYFAPQLYWPADAPQQSYPVLLNWWAQQNVKGRHLWPGLNDSNVGNGWTPEEIARQMQIDRKQGTGGEIHFHLRSVVDNPTLANIVRAEYAQPALVPASPWLGFSTPGRPRIWTTPDPHGSLAVRWLAATNEIPKSWVLQYRGTNGLWTTQILPANQTGCVFIRSAPELISVSMVNRCGNISPVASIGRVAPPVVSAPQPLPTPPPPMPARKFHYMGKQKIYD